MRNLTLIVMVCLLFIPVPRAKADDTLFAAVEATDMTPPVGVPLGGFGGGKRRLKFPFNLFHKYKYVTIFQPSLGIHDAIRSKVFLLKMGDKKLLFISLDVVGVSKEVYDDLVHRLINLGYNPNEIFISATHTHSGPGTLSNNPVWEVMVMDFFQKEIYDDTIGAVISTVLRAEANLQPADLYASSFQADGLQRNRRDNNGIFDPQANLLFARAKSGAWLGAMVNLAIHGTAFGSENLYFSADVPGGFERTFADRLTAMNQKVGTPQEATVLFVNGAEGDVGPKGGGEDGIAKMSDSFADQAMTAVGTARAIQPDWKVYSTYIDLGEAGLNLKACGNKIPVIDNMTIEVGPFLPHAPRFSLLKLGDMMLVTWPGEPTSALGLAVKSAVLNSGYKQSWLLGLTNGYVAYFTTPTEYFQGGYEACSTLYGPNGGEKIVGRLSSLISSF